ncbi:MAG: CYTH domain-containing protein [Saprospiraceae bacterium]|nr:CYTH domain-containing protein [Saprospiraceae bacterium]
MAREIERKFLVDALPESISGRERKAIRQGYPALEEGGREVRLRSMADRYFLTIKSQGDLEREEYEIELNKDQFENLWDATRGRRLRKDRIKYEAGDRLIEIDIYHQPLAGLIVAEIEFEDEAKAMAYEPEEWMGRELTHFNFLKNRNLLQFDSWEEVKDRLDDLSSD